MKKWVILAVVLTMVAGAEAKQKKGSSKGGGDISITKAAFMSTQKKKAETAGIAFDEAKAESAFSTQDKNGDGVLTADEQTSAKGKKGAKGKKK